MKKIMCLALLAFAGLLFTLSTPTRTQAQVSVNIGVEPVCPYGYYDYAPYACAPYGYYGPEWFVNGVFIGAGPWFHGAPDFHGHVDNHFDVQHGYKGPVPHAGDKADPANRVDVMPKFKGNEMRDGRGHVVKK
jgi:hypothetical protein